MSGRVLDRWGNVLAILAIVVLPALFVSSPFYLRIGALIFIASFAALGLNLLMGYAGQVSLGHAGFLGIGAYATAIVPAQLGVSPLLGAGVGVLAAGTLAYLVGRPILKLKGHYLAVATLALGILIAMVITNESRVTGGPDGMAVARLEVFGFRLRTPQHWYWITGGMLALGVIVAENLMRSPTGLALRALHDSEVASEVLGVDVARYKLIVFVVSAVYAALAGACLALLNGHITPEVAGFLRSIELVTMVVIGGMGSMLGAVVGAALLGLLEQALAHFHDIESIVLGVVMMAVMIFLRAGIVPSLAGLFKRRVTP